MGKRALITGIAGQDGTYLAEHLISEGYEVFGLVKGQRNPKISALKNLIPDLQLVAGDLLDQSSLVAAVDTVQPDEVYNLGAITFVPISWEQSALTTEVTGLGALRVLEAIRIVSGIGERSTSPCGHVPAFYQASTSEMFGQVTHSPQDEYARFHPRSPYGVAKTYAHYITQNYRESYGMFAVSGILFNHESPRRGPEFVTRKVTMAAARIKLGLQKELRLGNLEARRDWGFAGDYVKAMHAMLQAEVPEDFVIGTGRTHSVSDLVCAAFDCVGLDWRAHVKIDEKLFRPAEVDRLCADPTKAKEKLGWNPEIMFEDLIAYMVEADLARASRGMENVPYEISPLGMSLD